jgi:twinkle protein
MDSTDNSAARFADGEVTALEARKITRDTCEFFDYRTGTYEGKPVHIANYRKDGKLFAQKFRTNPKGFKVIGAGKSLPLYGQWLWKGSKKRVVITEGELDALTVSQLQHNKWPVVSVPNGAAGASRTITQQLEWVESFDEVVFAFDMDDPGQEAAKACAELLTPGKAFIAHLPMKDANECLQAGKGAELIQALWESKPFRPDGVVGVDSILEASCSPIQQGLDWPWPTLTAKTYGRRRRELYGFGAGTGCGKTDTFKEIIQHILQVDNLPVGLLFLEEPPPHTVKTLAGKIDNVRYHVPDGGGNQEQLEKTVKSLVGKVYLYDHFGAMGWKTIKEKIKYMVRALGIKDIFLDHLTALAAQLDDGDGGERKAIDKIMSELSALVQELDITIYYVSHLTTPEGKSHEEGGRVLEKHFRGSRSIAYWTHFLFGIERNKQIPDRPSVLRCLKDRYTGDANGLCIGLRYDKATGRMTECAVPEEESKKPFKPLKEETGEF